MQYELATQLDILTWHEWKHTVVNFISTELTCSEETIALLCSTEFARFLGSIYLLSAYFKHAHNALNCLATTVQKL